MARLFAIISVLIVVLVCTSNVAQGRNVFHSRRGEVPDKEGLQEAGILTSAGLICLNSSPEEVSKLANALKGCIAGGDKHLQRNFMLRVIGALSFLTGDVDVEARMARRKRDNSISKKSFNRRDLMADTMTTLLTGPELFELLDEKEHQRLLRVISKLVKAPQSVKDAYVIYITLYAEKCAAGENFD